MGGIGDAHELFAQALRAGSEIDISHFGAVVREAYRDASTIEIGDRIDAFLARHGVVLAEATSPDRIFRDALVEAVDLIATGRVAPIRPVVDAGKDYDFLDPGKSRPDQLRLQPLALLACRAIAPVGKCAAVVCMRDDGIFVVDWVAYYRAIGFEHIFVFTNDNQDASDALLERLAERGVITLIRNDIDPSTSPQRKAYEFSLYALAELRRYEWVFFVDSDEFLVLPDRFEQGIASALAEVAREAPASTSCIMYNWRMCVSGWQFTRRPGDLLQAYPHMVGSTSVKSVARVQDIVSTRHLHFPVLSPNRLYVDADLRVVQRHQLWEKRPPSYGRGQLNHYWFKSFLEFSIKKARGDTLVGEGVRDYRRQYASFFALNAGETAENRVDPPERLVAAMRGVADQLRRDPAVAAAEKAVQVAFEAMIASMGGEEALLAIYRAEMATRGLGRGDGSSEGR